MNNLEQLTASRNYCDGLFLLGISPVSFLWWVESEETQNERKVIEEGLTPKHITYEVAPVINPSPGPMCLPAWTKTEIDVMIGPDFSPKPDLFTQQQIGNSKMLKPESYPVYTMQKMQVFENGADASAFALIYLIEGGLLKASECNNRYSKLFRPFKK